MCSQRDYNNWVVMTFRYTKVNLRLEGGARGSVVVKALSYKWRVACSIPYGGEFLNLSKPFGRSRPLEFTQPLTKISTRKIKIIVLGE
jgi:hypothetical protein